MEMNTEQQDWYVLSYDKEKEKLSIEGGPLDYLHAIWKTKETASRTISELNVAEAELYERERADGPADDDNDDGQDCVVQDYVICMNSGIHTLQIGDGDSMKLVGIVKYSPHDSISVAEPGANTEQQGWYVVSCNSARPELSIEGGPLDYAHAVWKLKETAVRRIFELDVADSMQEAKELYERADDPIDGGQAYGVSMDFGSHTLQIGDGGSMELIGIVKYSPHGSIPGTEPGC